MGNKRSSLKDVPGEIISGVKNMAQALESKITENEDRGNTHEQFLTSMYDELHRIMQVLTQNREEEAQNGLVAIDRKLNGVGKH